MANKKFSEFVLKTSTSDVSHIVGYNGAENVQITPANFVTGGGTGVFLPLAGGTMTGNTIHNDNVKSIYGTSSDLEIFHDGSNSFIKDVGTGNLKLRATNLNLQSEVGADYISCISGGASEIYFNNAKKFETTSTGISVTGNGTFAGTVLIDGVNSFSGLEIKGASSNKPSLNFSNANAGILGQIYGSETSSLIFATTPSGTTALTLDASQNATFAGNVILGIADSLYLNGTTGVRMLHDGSNALFINQTAGDFVLSNSVSNKDMVFKLANSERMRLDSSGNLGVGTSSYSNRLQVTGGSIGIDSEYMLRDNKNNTIFLQSASTLASNRTFTIGNSTYNNIIIPNGNLGIGTSSPETKMNIEGTTDTELRIKGIANTTGQGASVGLFEGAAGINGGRIRYDGGTNSLNLLGVDGTSTERLGIAIARDTGNVGVGTATSDARITLADHTTPAGGIKFRSAASSVSLYSQGSGTLTTNGSFNVGGRVRITGGNAASDPDVGLSQTGGIGFTRVNTNDIGFITSSSEKMRLTSAGYLGLGTATPSDFNSKGRNLVVNSDGDTGITISANTSSSSTLLFADAFAGTGGTATYRGSVEYDHAIDSMLFSTAATERMRLTSAGDLLIGATSTSSATGSWFEFAGSGRRILNLANDSTAGLTVQKFINANGLVGSIVTSGSATAYNTSSDYRLKEDLQDFKGLDLVSKIPVYDFKWKADESRSYGVMAHQLQEVLPQAVNGEKDAEEMQSVDYSKIVPLLVKSIQELSAKLEALECQCEKK